MCKKNPETNFRSRRKFRDAWRRANPEYTLDTVIGRCSTSVSPAVSTKPRFMKLMMRRLLPLCSAAIGLLFAHSALAAISFTVTPPATSNAYTGFVTLAGTGLFTNETVVVRKYIDLNTNGVVDASDFFVEQFRVTDQASATLIGGATNINIPYDANATQGAISASLSILGGVSQRVVAQYLYVFSSPSNHFTAVTNSFAITNSSYAQTISGTVVSNATPIPYAFVLVGYSKNSSDFNPFTGAIANSLGVYSVKVPPGIYQAVAFKTNFIGVPAGPFTVASSGSVVTNVSLVAANSTITGRITDSTNSSLALAGFLVTAQGNGIAASATDTNGNYTLPAIQGSQWKVGGDNGSWNVGGYVRSNDSVKIAITTAVTNVNLSFPRVEAMVYGKVVDTNNNPLANVRLQGQNGNNGNQLFQGDATTDSNGKYAMGLVAGNWDAEIDVGSTPPQYSNYVFSVLASAYNNSGNGVTLTAGTSIRQDFIGVLATNTISGTLKDNNNVGLAGVTINANATINGTNFSAQAVTDVNGFYSCNAANGNWNVSPNCCNQCTDGVPSIYQCPNNQQTTVANNNKTINFVAQRATVLSGKVTDNVGNPVANINVFANGDAGGSSGAQTDSGGNYALGLSSGGYTVQLDTGTSGISTHGLIGPFLHVNIASTDVTNFNLVCQPITGTIAASVTNSSTHVGVSGINFDASCTLNGTNYDTGGQTTDGTGKASLAVCNGSWTVTANCSDLSSLSLTCPNNNNSVATVSGNSPAINYLVQPCTLQINNTNFPPGTNGVFYDASLSGSGCYPPFNWFYQSGTIPSGLNFGNNGELSGTPTVTGTFTFTVQIQDQQFNTATTNVSITILAAASPLQITTGSLPNALQGGAYNASVNATGGTPPYHWSIENGSAFPPAAITLGTNGQLSGTCTANAGTYFFHVQAVDNSNATNALVLSITVTNAPVQIATTSLPNGNNTAYYNNNLVATGGQPPYSWSVELGSAPLPANLALSSSGVISGTPVVTGTFAFHAQVNDNNGGQTSRLLQLTINPLPMLTQPFRANPSQFQFHLNGSPGQNYTLQYSGSLTSWTSLVVTNPNSTDVLIVDPTATNSMRGYRALIGP
jgi:hypothetical protein